MRTRPELTRGPPDLVDKKRGNEIRQESDATVYDSLEDVADNLSENTARFVLLSYPSPHVNPPTPPGRCVMQPELAMRKR